MSQDNNLYKLLHPEIAHDAEPKDNSSKEHSYVLNYPDNQTISFAKSNISFRPQH